MEDRSGHAYPRRGSLPDLGRLKPTAVYNSYWRFATERQNVFFRRFEGARHRGRVTR